MRDARPRPASPPSGAEVRARALRFVAGALLVVVACLVVAALDDHADARTLRSRGVVTEATVTDVRAARGGGDHDLRFRTRDGVVVTARDVPVVHEDIRAGDRIEVVYDPRDPDTFAADADDPDVDAAVSWFWAAVAGAGTVAVLLRARRLGERARRPTS